MNLSTEWSKDMNNRSTPRMLLVALAFAWLPAHAAVNPFDQVGFEHNVYLECLMAKGGDTTVSPLRRIVEECGFDPGTSIDDFIAGYSQFVDVDPSLSVVERMRPYRARYTDAQFSFFEKIDQVLLLAETQAEADAMFADLEADAIARLGTRTAAERSIFAALSTARHSLEYWSLAYAPPAAAAGAISPQRLKWWQKVLIVVGADLLGAAGGTLIGGPVVGAGTGAASSTGAATVLKD